MRNLRRCPSTTAHLPTTGTILHVADGDSGAVPPFDKRVSPHLIIWSCARRIALSPGAGVGRTTERRAVQGKSGAHAGRWGAGARGLCDTIKKGTRVLISLWDSLMFRRVPGTRPNISKPHSEISTRVPSSPSGCGPSGRS